MCSIDEVCAETELRGVSGRVGKKQEGLRAGAKSRVKGGEWRAHGEGW